MDTLPLYGQIVSDGRLKLTSVLEFIDQLLVYELLQQLKEELQTLKKRINSYNSKKFSADEEEFNEQIEVFGYLQEGIKECQLLASELISKVNKLPKDQKDYWYQRAGIVKIPTEFENMSNDLKKLVKQIDDIVDNYIDKYSYLF